MKKLLSFLFVVQCSAIFGQFNFENRENELSVLLDSLRSAKNNDQKEHWNNQFKTLMSSTLNEPSIFEQTFTKLSTVGVIDSPDGLVKIVNWNVEQDDQSQKYYAFVLHRDLRKNTHVVIELIDNSFMLPGKPDDILDADNWYGALYYQIIPVEKSNKLYYTVLGWDGGTTSSNTKLIDVISFTGSSLKLGQSLFKMGDQNVKRIFFEHSEKTVMSLKWEPEYKRIIFDHLSPETPSMTGFYEYYVPDMSYDALVFEGTKWILKEDVIGVNKSSVEVKLSSIDPKTGEVITESIDNKWIDPTTEGSPASKEVHIAMTPDEELAQADKEKKPKGKSETEPKTALEAYNEKKHHRNEKNPDSIVKTPKKKKTKKH
jgi:hypothetical protein